MPSRLVGTVSRPDLTVNDLLTSYMKENFTCNL